MKKNDLMWILVIWAVLISLKLTLIYFKLADILGVLEGVHQ